MTTFELIIALALLCAIAYCGDTNVLEKKYNIYIQTIVLLLAISVDGFLFYDVLTTA